MKIFGVDVSLWPFGQKAAPGTALSNVPPPPRITGGGWLPMFVREAFAGAWQRNITFSNESVLANSAVYACVSRIVTDIGKCRFKLVAKQPQSGIWKEVSNPAFTPVLRKPNGFQTHIQFKEWWLASKLIHGNAYALKRRDGRGIVTELYLLDPTSTKPLVAPDGQVFYAIAVDNLAGVDNAEASLAVPASEIIHDRMNCLFHPLVGVSPIMACGLAASQGMQIQEDSVRFFRNAATPGGVLTAPAKINDETAARLKAHWETEYSGDKAGRIAVLGDGLTFEPMRMSAHDSQVIEQLKWTAEIVCTAFGVPAFMVGVGQMPAYNNIESLQQGYYSQCLQSHIEAMEAVLDEGLGIDMPVQGTQYGVELDLQTLLRMDTASKTTAAKDAVAGGFMAPNEARAMFDLPPVKGGETPYLQQQNYSLSALADRDADKPFSKPAPAPAPAPSTDPAADPAGNDSGDGEGSPPDSSASDNQDGARSAAAYEVIWRQFDEGGLLDELRETVLAECELDEA